MCAALSVYDVRHTQCTCRAFGRAARVVAQALEQKQILDQCRADLEIVRNRQHYLTVRSDGLQRKGRRCRMRLRRLFDL